MKKKSILISIALASLLQANEITSIEYINLTKVSTSIANETLDLRIGDEYDYAKIDKAIKAFYKYDYFEDITASNNNGKLEILFKEKPSIANVEIDGYKSREDDIEILKKQIGVKKGTMYSAKRIKKAKNALLKMLESEGYINSVVEVEVDNISDSAVSVYFNVNKGDEIVIKNVNYFGSDILEQDDFEIVTANKEEEFASWFITQNDGELKADQLEYDGKRIKELYLEHGFLDAQVKDPFLEVDFASNQADLDFYIEEGKQYTTNEITIFVNSEIIDPKKLYPELKLKKDRTFNIKKLRKDVEFIKTEVANLGYAFTQVKFDIKQDPKTGKADVVFNVIPGEKVFIRDVKISGNTRTLDRVIRRNVYLAPGDLFNLTDFNDTKSKLKRTGFFEDIIIEQKRISADKMDLVVKAKEAPTGNIILGGGYGSYDKVMVNVALNERNIFGSGIGVSISTELSARESDLTLKVTNPAINDSEYSGYVDIYSKESEIDRDDYELTKDVKGFTVGLGKELFRNLRAGASYKLDFVKEEYDYESTSTARADRRYQNTDYVTSSITPYLNYNSTNDYYFPTEGIKAGTSLEFAGVGGDSEFLKSSSYFKYFHSLEDQFDLNWVLRYKAQVKMLVDNGQINQGDSLYLGGTKTLRGFKSYAFGPNNDSGEVEDPSKYMAATSVEMSFPLSDPLKMRWGAFYDYGMIGQDSFGDTKRSSVGALFEWISPFGPLQLIFANPLDDESGDDTSSFEFSLGSSF